MRPPSPSAVAQTVVSLGPPAGASTRHPSRRGWGAGNGGEGRNLRPVRNPVFRTRGVVTLLCGGDVGRTNSFPPPGCGRLPQRLRVGAWCGLFVACDNGCPEQDQDQDTSSTESDHLKGRGPRGDPAHHVAEALLRDGGPIVAGTLAAKIVATARLLVALRKILLEITAVLRRTTDLGRSLQQLPKPSQNFRVEY